MEIMVLTFGVIARNKLDKVDKTLSTVEVLNKCSLSDPGKNLGCRKQGRAFRWCSECGEPNFRVRTSF